mgnify:CR=1 FL=1
MKKNPIGKYLLQNWYYYVFAFGSMALSVFLDMLAPLVTLHIVDDVSRRPSGLRKTMS